jgi:hypothetical protein
MYKQTNQSIRMIVGCGFDLHIFYRLQACMRSRTSRKINLQAQIQVASKDEEAPVILLQRILMPVKTLKYHRRVSLPDNQNGNSRVATFYAIGVQKYKAREIAGSTL